MPRGREGGPDDRNLVLSPLEMLALGPGHHPDLQILTRGPAAFCPLSGCSIGPGGGCMLQAQRPEPGPQWPLFGPRRHFLMNGALVSESVDIM